MLEEAAELWADEELLRGTVLDNSLPHDLLLAVGGKSLIVGGIKVLILPLWAVLILVLGSIDLLVRSVGVVTVALVGMRSVSLVGVVTVGLIGVRGVNLMGVVTVGLIGVRSVNLMGVVSIVSEVEIGMRGLVGVMAVALLGVGSLISFMTIALIGMGSLISLVSLVSVTLLGVGLSMVDLSVLLTITLLVLAQRANLMSNILDLSEDLCVRCRLVSKTVILSIDGILSIVLCLDSSSKKCGTEGEFHDDR